MKKIINKLFEWLGYVPKGSFDIEKKYCNDQKKIDKCICEGKTYYIVYNTPNHYVVAYTVFDEGIDFNKRVIKSFSKDNPDYARICAEELCDMLNKKY